MRDAQKTYPVEIMVNRHNNTVINVIIELYSDSYFSENVYAFSAFSEAFLAFIYSDLSAFVGDEWQQKIVQIIESVYQPISTKFSFCERYMLYQQLHGNLVSVKSVTRKDYVMQEVLSSLKNSTQKLNYDDYTVLLADIEKGGGKIPVRDYYAFETFEDAGYWLFEQIVNSNQIIRKCRCCDKYYVCGHALQRFCSTKCRTAYNNKNAYSGEIELRKLDNQIRTLIVSRQQTGLEYLYYPTPEITRPVLSLSVDKIYQSNDIANVYSEYCDINNSLKSELRMVKSQFENGDIEPTNYHRHFEMYKNMLIQIHLQVKALKKDS